MKREAVTIKLLGGPCDGTTLALVNRDDYPPRFDVNAPNGPIVTLRGEETWGEAQGSYERTLSETAEGWRIYRYEAA